MSQALRERLYAELDSLTLIDPHTHIDPHVPASSTLADILGYHYYTELAHSAGMEKSQIEESNLAPKEKVARLITNLEPLNNTIQYSWLIEMSQELFGFQGDRITIDNWESVYNAAFEVMSQPHWANEVLRQSHLEAVFLTNDFDDPLEHFDTSIYIPCLRTDELVFRLEASQVRQRLEDSTGVGVTDAASIKRALGVLFQRFVEKGAKACAISLPPNFSPAKVSPGRADTALDAICRSGDHGDDVHRKAVAQYVFWTIAEFCQEYSLPFDLMIGVNRGVYEEGVYQGQDLFDSRCSLIQYKSLFNAFPDVTFPISVLASVTNQELASYSWIFPNVVTNGHWWYSNTPPFIELDAAARLEAVPRTKQIAYYSDMYKLEFALPKFNMYKRILAKVLAERFVIDRRWSEDHALEFGRQILRGNVEAIFDVGQPSENHAQSTEDASSPRPSLAKREREHEIDLDARPPNAVDSTSDTKINLSTDDLDKD